MTPNFLMLPILAQSPRVGRPVEDMDPEYREKLIDFVFGLRAAPIAWETRELIEMGAALGLVLGVALGAALLVVTLRRNRRIEGQLRRTSAVFAELLEQRFGEWQLTPSERDVAWYTLKGMSHAEIARLRQTSEGTVKAQSNAIYRNAGVGGRTQLLSLFLEDLMERSAGGARGLARGPRPDGRRLDRRRPNGRRSGGRRPGGQRTALTPSSTRVVATSA